MNIPKSDSSFHSSNEVKLFQVTEAFSLELHLGNDLATRNSASDVSGSNSPQEVHDNSLHLNSKKRKLSIEKLSIFVHLASSDSYLLLWNCDKRLLNQQDTVSRGIRNNIYQAFSIWEHVDTLEEEEGAPHALSVTWEQKNNATILDNKIASHAEIAKNCLKPCNFQFQTLKDLLFFVKPVSSHDSASGATTQQQTSTQQKYKIPKFTPLQILERSDEEIIALIRLETPQGCKTEFLLAKIFHHHTGKRDKPEEEFNALKSFEFEPIGIFESVFPEKNGTPRQGSIITKSKGRLKIKRPSAAASSLDCLDQYSHLWLIFVFHRNAKIRKEHTKIRPPRLNGKKVGLYASRTPHRPNPIGLTLAKIDAVEKGIVYLSGVDLLDRTPILDIKPYVTYSDEVIPTEGEPKSSVVQMPSWIEEAPTVGNLPRENISFSSEAKERLQMCAPHLKFYKTAEELEEAICEVLQSDPRPVYMRKKQMDKLYGFRIDKVNVRCLFDENDCFTVVDVELW